MIRTSSGPAVHLNLNAGEEGKEMLLEVDHRSLDGLEDLFSAQGDELSLAILRKVLVQQPDKEPGVSLFRII